METTESYTIEPTKEDIDNLEKDFQFVPERPGDYVIDRKAYIKAMFEVENEFQLGERGPRLVLFVLEQLYRSPKIVDSPKVRKKHKNK
ncbi:hypothetical protein [Clostridium sp.]|uniref:hypothetical protein n=1 Tax=Clostridium sp. TaxID=1506 RepID=UPI001A40DF7E|nr:hypothetical protein [Clostridium sp.]MBK5243239.1 hypothetical protein [Clostridium sp.]